MTIAELIATHFRTLYAKGISQNELSRRYNVPQTYISTIISGKQNADNIRLITVQRMFPNASIALNDATHGESEYSLPQAPAKPLRIDSIDDGLSFMDKAMLEEWGKLDQHDKCRVMGFIAQLEKEKSADRATTA